MERVGDEFFGSESQRALQARAAQMWQLLNDDPRFCCHGRVVAVSGHGPETTADQIALAVLQGVGPADGVPAHDREARLARLHGAGLETDVYVRWRGGAGAVAAARRMLDTRALPADLRAGAVDANTAPAVLAGLDALTQGCGVLLPMGRFLRGKARPSAFVFAQDEAGRIVCAAGAVAHHHPRSDRAGQVWWGMLSTATERRGAGLALILGAMAITAMADRHGYADLVTGIRPGNAPSEALCRKLGFAPTDAHDIIAIHPPTFAAGRLTT